MIVNFVREFYAKCNRTVVHTSSMPQGFQSINALAFFN
jgi:hypothetical protein